MSRRLAARATWMRARATNTLRRPLAILAATGLFAAVALAGLVFVPQQPEPVHARGTQRIPERPDSMSTVRAKAQMLTRLSATDSLIAVARGEAAAAAGVPADSYPAPLRASRDSLAFRISMLSALISRAENVPLPASYRALARSRFLAAEPGTRAALDSLAEIDRERESFGAVGGMDPVYVALTTRANTIGRTLLAKARQRRSAMRAELARLTPLPVVRPTVAPAVDTLLLLATREAIRRDAIAADRQLQRIRARDREISVLEQELSETRERDASFAAMLGAALVVGLVLGFAVILLGEMRHPRISDVREAEQASGLRALAVVRPYSDAPDRSRRRSDRVISEVLEPFADHYRQLYLHLTSRDKPLVAVTFTGDEPEIAAVVAANVAAFDVREARSALVIDTDPVTSGIARALGVPSEPGLTSVLAGETAWSEALVYTPVERDQVLEVMPSGRRAGKPSAERAGRVRAELTRVASRYDLIVFVATLQQVPESESTVLISRDVVACARIAHSSLKGLGAAIERLRGGGMIVHGLVLWDAEPVRLPPVLRRVRRAGGRERAAARV